MEELDGWTVVIAASEDLGNRVTLAHFLLSSFSSVIPLLVIELKWKSRTRRHGDRFKFVLNGLLKLCGEAGQFEQV